MNEDWLENIAATSLAHGYIIELLLARFLERVERGPAREAYATSLIEAGSRIDGLQALGLDAEDAVRFADVVLKSHAQLVEMVRRAMRRAAAGGV